MQKKNSNKILFCIFILALSLRVFAVFNQKESARLPGSDAKQYDNIAVNIVSGKGFADFIGEQAVPTAIRPPVYPMFLAAIYAVFGHRYFSVKIIQAILGALFCIVIFLITRRIAVKERTAFIAAFVTAVYPPFIYGFNYYGGPALLLTEYLYAFLIGIALLMLCLFIDKDNKKIGILSGVFIGLAMLTRPEFVFFAVTLTAYLFYINRFSVKKLIKRYTVVYIGIMLALLPWTIRNGITMKGFIPLTTFGGSTFWIGNSSIANGGWAYPEGYREISESRTLSETEKSKILFNRGIQDLKTNPKRIPELLVRKILVYWAPFEEGLKKFNLYYAVIFMLAFIGAVFYRRRTIEEGVLFVVFLGGTLGAIILFGDPRYRYPFEAYLIIFSAYAIDGFLDIAKNRFIPK